MFKGVHTNAMACDVKVAFSNGSASPNRTPPLLKDETTMDLYLEYDKDLRRSVVNQEFMVYYGNDPSRYLPPLPQQERPKSSLAAAWSCSNPAMRQLGNLSRRGPRRHFPGASSQKKPALISAELTRPHTAHINQVQEVLQTKYERRPQTSAGKLESMPFRMKCKPPEVNDDLLIKPKPLPVLPPEELPEPEPLVHTPAGGFRRPGRHKDSPRKGQNNAKGGSVFPNLEKKRLEDLAYLMKGNFSHLPPDIPTTVRIYLAGTKQDFTKEREVLDQEILPVLREFCENQGVELEILDMGVERMDTTLNLKTHFTELDKSQKESLGPFYVLLLGDYSSPVYLPPEIPAADFDIILKMTSELKVANKDLIKVFYKRDNNALPPKYIFQMDEMENKSDLKVLVNLWQNLMGIAEQAGKFTAEKCQKYEAKPVVEHEVSRIFQLLNKSSGNSKTKGINCLCFHRSFQGLSERMEEGSVVPDFTNIYEDEDSLSVDHQAMKKLVKLKDIIKRHLPEENLKSYQLPWTGSGIDWQNSEEHQAYLNSFIENFIESVKKLVLYSKDQWKIKNRNGHLYGELLEHSRNCLYHVRSFNGREQELKAVHSYIKDNDLNEKPFVIYGKSGIGKSSLVSIVAKQCKEWLSKHCVTVFRYLGATPKSSDLNQTLVTLCLQICAIYNMEAPPESDHDSINKMAIHFANTLELVSKHHATKKPLVVLLDGIEKLKESDRADTLFWLPQIIPRNVFLLISVNSSSKTLLRRLHKRLNNEELFLEVGDLIQADLSGAIDNILKCSHRTLSEFQEQKNMLLHMYSSYSSPLFVRTLCLEASKWQSDSQISQYVLPQTTGEAITKMCYKLEDVYGIKFVQKVMSYLCLLPQGITEKELCDLMCSDQEVLQNIYVQHEFEKHDVLVFDYITKTIRALLNDIEGYFIKPYIYGRHLIQWSCDKYRETLGKKYFGATNPFTGKNDNIDDTIRKVNNLFIGEKPLTLKIKAENNSDYFELKSPTMPYHLSPANSRKLKVLPQLISHSGSEVDFSKQLKDTCLCYFAWLLSKVQAFHPNEIVEDFKNITERDIEVDTLRTFFEIAKPGLKPDPKTFALQLLGSMPYLDEDYPLLNQMLIDAQNWIEGVAETLLLVPMFPSFPNPLDTCKAKLWNLVDILQIEKSGRLGVMKNENGHIEVWDLENNEYVFNLGIRFDKVQPNVFTNKTHVLGFNGTILTIWEIESGSVICNIDIEALLNKNVSTICVFCHTADFSVVTIHTSDEEFNQSLVFIDVKTEQIFHTIDEFDVKDEFFKDSALFNEEGTKMVFVMARSEVVDDKKNADFIKIKICDIESRQVQSTIECGEKKFNKLLFKDNQHAIVSWKDCSFDVINVESGGKAFTLPAPDSRLTVEDCSLTEDNYLVGLSSSLPNVDRKYYALWFWNVEEQSSVNLLSQSFDKSEEVPKQFLIIEELHIAILASPDTTALSIWDLPNSERIHSMDTHMGSLDNIIKTKDPYKIYSCSSNEEVVKSWDLYDIIRKAKEDKIQKSKNRNRSAFTDVSSVKSNNTEGILKKKKKKVLRKTKSVRFADENFSMVSDDVQSIRESEFTEDNFESNSPPNGEVKDELKDELADLGNPGRDENVLATQLETMVGATGISYAQDGSYLILASDRSPPTMWEMNNGHVIKRLEPHDDHDLCTTWAEMTCNDEIVIGLTTDEDTKDILPAKYKYQAWDLNSAEPLLKDSELQFICTLCTVSVDRERAVLCCVQETATPAKDTASAAQDTGSTVQDTGSTAQEKGSAAQDKESIVQDTASFVTQSSDSSNVKKHLIFYILDIRKHEVLQEAHYHSICIPNTLQVMDDCSYCVTDHRKKPGDKNLGYMVYHLEVSTTDVLEPEMYEYMEGDKYKDYRATGNVVLPSGQLSLSTGLNGDMQVWDITNREYEGNLYCDPSVKDTRNPSLHNHGGKRVVTMAVSEDGGYLVCGGGDGGTSVWDLENEVNVFTYGGHTSEVIKVAISHDNQLILTAGNDMLLNVWKHGVIERPLCRLYVHSVITSLHIATDNKSVALIGERRNQPATFMLFQLKNAPEPIET